jgi:hypothetical protein
VCENILRNICVISYGQLCAYHHPIENQDIWCDVYYHLATKIFLTLQASGFRSNQEKLYVLKKSDVLVCHSGCSGLQPMHSTKICSAESSLAKPDVLKS